MWTCSRCERIFETTNQPHSCKRVPIVAHFKNKDKAKELFDYLVEQVNNKIGKCKVISIPCCIHLFGKYDFLAALPKKDGLEVRFALDRKLDSPRLKICVPMSAKVFKNCFDISSKEELDIEFIGWLKQSYYLKS
jgi:hypothetical protein